MSWPQYVKAANFLSFIDIYMVQPFWGVNGTSSHPLDFWSIPLQEEGTTIVYKSF